MNRQVRNSLIAVALVAAGAIAVGSVVVVRALLAKSVQIQVEPIARISIEDAAVERLAGAILLKQGFRPRRTVLLAFGHDEEIGGQAGAAKIAELLKSRGIRVAYALDEGSAITERIVPGLEPARGPDRDRRERTGDRGADGRVAGRALVDAATANGRRDRGGGRDGAREKPHAGGARRALRGLVRQAGAGTAVADETAVFEPLAV
jgi:hypothetical protein